MQERITPIEPFKDVREFGKMLSRRHPNIHKTNKQIALECGIPVSGVTAWEQAFSFPVKDKLPIIAKVYGIDLTELTGKWELSKNTREREKKNTHEARKKPSKKGTKADTSPGFIEKRKQQMRSNEGTDFRLGRA